MEKKFQSTNNKSNNYNSNNNNYNCNKEKTQWIINKRVIFFNLIFCNLERNSIILNNNKNIIENEDKKLNIS